MGAKLTRMAFWRGGHPYLLARIYKATSSYNEQAIVQADVSSIAYAVYNQKTLASLATGTLTAGDVVLNALSTGNIWTVDSTGFNFVWIAGRTLFTASVVHRVVITLSLSNGQDVVVDFELPALNPAGD